MYGPPSVNHISRTRRPTSKFHLQNHRHNGSSTRVMHVKCDAECWKLSVSVIRTCQLRGNWSTVVRTAWKPSDILMHIPCCVWYFSLVPQFLFSVIIHNTKLPIYFLRHVVTLYHSPSLLENNPITTWHVTNNQPPSYWARILHQIRLVQTRAAHRYTMSNSHQYIYCSKTL